MKKVIVKLENFSKSFKGKTIVDNVNLDIYEGEFLTFLGSSGCGKTTILRSISGLDHPTVGKVYLDGVDVTDLEPQKREVNTIFQNYSLFELMSVYDNIAFGLRMKKVPEKEIKIKIDEMLDLVHLKGYEKRLPKELSGGESQRVAIARGLINNPKVLLLDEPLSALDLKLRKEMQIELKQLQKKFGITFIYVTHDQDEALTMSDRIVLLNNHKIEQIGTPVDVYKNPKNLYVADFLGEANIFNGIIKEVTPGYSFVELDTKDVIKINTNEKFVSNDLVSIVVRPENVGVTKTERKINCLKGIVKDKIFDGSSTKIIIKYNKKEVKSLYLDNKSDIEKGMEIYFYWDIKDGLCLESETHEK